MVFGAVQPRFASIADVGQRCLRSHQPVILGEEAPRDERPRVEILAGSRPAQGTMIERPGRPEEVASAILFLASDASNVTGAPLFVDGGMTAESPASTTAGPPCDGPGRFRSWRALNEKAGRWRVDRTRSRPRGPAGPFPQRYTSVPSCDRGGR